MAQCMEELGEDVAMWPDKQTLDGVQGVGGSEVEGVRVATVSKRVGIRI